jgi:hypothetical protein
MCANDSEETLMIRAPLHIGQKPQLLVDNYAIEYTNFVTRTMHPPTKHEGNPILYKDRPWEILPHFRQNANVQWDPDENLFKAWYEDLGWDYDEFMRLERLQDSKKEKQVAAIASFEKTTENRLLYAESDDGIYWRKPALDYRAIDGRKTNICLGNDVDGRIHAATIMRDTIDPGPAGRYKALYWNSHEGLHDSRIVVARSPDGRRWTPYPDRLLIGQMADRQLGDVMCLTADVATGEYYLDARARHMQEPPVNPKHPTVAGWGPAYYPRDAYRSSKRRVSTSLSRDLLYWPMLTEMITPNDVLDNLDEEFYGLARFRIGDLHLGLMPIFRRTHNTVTTHLVYSRDGFAWHRVDRGDPFIDTGADDAWDCFMAEIGTTPVFLDDEIRFYYSGANLHHDWWMFGEKEGLDVPEARSGWNGGRTALGLAALRHEGFVSIDSTAREGIIATQPLLSDGSQLIVNVDCGTRGYLDVELADINDDVIPGYERSRCIRITGDSTREAVRWKNGGDLPTEIARRGLKIRFFSRHCSLYSFVIRD